MSVTSNIMSHASAMTAGWVRARGPVFSVIVTVLQPGITTEAPVTRCTWRGCVSCVRVSDVSTDTRGLTAQLSVREQCQCVSHSSHVM